MIPFNSTRCRVISKRNIIKVVLLLLPFISIFLISNVLAASSEDYSSPRIISVIRTPREDIMPWDKVTIKAIIVDDESGLKEALLYYGVGESPQYITFKEIHMKLVEGDIYNGTYIGEIPPQPSKSQVWYYIKAVDRAGNTVVYPCEECYETCIIKQPYSRISTSIYILDVNTKNMTVLLQITMQGILPSKYNYTSINVIIRQIFYNQTVNVVSVKMNKSGGRYQYVSVFYWRIKLLGKPENYPYDWYNINLNITFYWGPVDELEAGPVHLSPTVRKDWNYTANRTPSNKIQPEIVYNIHLKRSPYSRYLVNWVIASMEILLSASLLLPAHELDKRSGIYISLLLFSLGFLYKVKEYAPFTTVPTLAEATIITMDMIFIMILVATI